MSTSASDSGGQPAPGPGQGMPAIPVICDTCRARGSAGEGGFSGIADILNFEPVPRRTQVNNWTAELQRAFIAALAVTGSARRAGKAIGRHEYGAEKLRKARGGKSFSEAWDAALDIYREREMARLGDQMSELSNVSLEQAQKMDLEPGERDEDEARKELEEVRERTRQRLLRARRQMSLNAHHKGDEEVRRAAQLRLYEVLPSEKPGTLEYDVWQSIYALEGELSHERGKTTRLSRTRQKIGRDGEEGTVADLVLGKVSDGFRMLVERDMPKLTFEVVALKHADRFDARVLAAAEQRLIESGYDPRELA